MGYIAIVYESKSGHTKTLAEAVGDGVKSSGLDAKLIPVEKAVPQDLLNAAGIVAGSYTSYGIIGGRLKTFFDETIVLHGQLEGKVGGAFASSGGLGGGNESTVLSILQILLVHGLIIPGNARSPHYGAVAIGNPDAKALDAARDLGSRVALLAKKLTV